VSPALEHGETSEDEEELQVTSIQKLLKVHSKLLYCGKLFEAF